MTALTININTITAAVCLYLLVEIIINLVKTVRLRKGKTKFDEVDKYYSAVTKRILWHEGFSTVLAVLASVRMLLIEQNYTFSLVFGLIALAMLIAGLVAYTVADNRWNTALGLEEIVQKLAKQQTSKRKF